MIRNLLVCASYFLLAGCISTNPPAGNTTPTPTTQPENATIVGRITLLSGDPAVGMLVELYPHCFEGPILAKTTTGSKGEYIFKNMHPQMYSVAYNGFRKSPIQPGLSSECRNPIYFEAGKTKYLDFRVKPRS